jgi:hypothetical protein
MAFVKYIEKMISYHEKKFEELPKQTVSSPLKKGDLPDPGMSELLDAQGIILYQSLLGTLKWAFTFRGFDINGIKVTPRLGHIHRMKHVYGYLSKMSHVAVYYVIEQWILTAQKSHILSMIGQRLSMGSWKK